MRRAWPKQVSNKKDLSGIKGNPIPRRLHIYPLLRSNFLFYAKDQRMVERTFSLAHAKKVSSPKSRIGLSCSKTLMPDLESTKPQKQLQSKLKYR
jgi:hypothetical protein